MKLFKRVPRIFAFADVSASFALITLSFSVVPELTTRIVPSHLFERICASATERIGGVSKMTRSYCAVSSWMSTSIDFEPISSAGFGGIGPHVIKNRPSISVTLVTSSRLHCFVSKLDSPVVFVVRNVYCIVGLRMSASTSSTFFPSCAKTIATFAALVDLPSPGEEEVNSNVFNSLSGIEKLMFVRTVRNCSETIDFGLYFVTNLRATVCIGRFFFVNMAVTSSFFYVVMPLSHPAFHYL